MSHVVPKILSPYVWTRQIFFENVHDILVKTHLEQFHNSRHGPHLKIPKWHSHIITSRMSNTPHVSARLPASVSDDHSFPDSQLL